MSNSRFYALNKGHHLAERFSLRSENADVYVSTHLKTGNSDLLHYHEEPHMTFMLNGGLIDKRKHGETERFPGDMMFFESGEPHQTMAGTFPTKYISISFNPNFFSENRAVESAVKRSIENTMHAKFTVLKIYRELLTYDDFTESSVETLLLDLTSSKGVTRQDRPAWVNKVVEFLNDNWDQDISLQDLSAVAGVHPVSISRYFPKCFDCTLSEYRRRLKIERSLQLIKTGGYSLTEATYRCNFSDQSHFTRTFREVTGFLPKQFQKL